MMRYPLLRAVLLLALFPLLHGCDRVNEPGGLPGNAASSETPSAVIESDELKGLKLYLGYCFVCHGQKGDGRGPYAASLSARPADFTDSTYFNARTDDELYDFISKGGIAHGKSVHMKPFGFQLLPDQIRSTVAYIRVLNRHEPLDGPEGAGFSGEEIYRNSCVMCHGKEGAGDGRVAKMLNLKMRPFTPETLDSYSGAKLYNIVENGFPSDSTGVRSYMPAWGSTLSEQEIIDVIALIRSFGK